MGTEVVYGDVVRWGREWEWVVVVAVVVVGGRGYISSKRHGDAGDTQTQATAPPPRALASRREGECGWGHPFDFAAMHSGRRGGVGEEEGGGGGREREGGGADGGAVNMPL